jgi:hypothetical protein
MEEHAPETITALICTLVGFIVRAIERRRDKKKQAKKD